MILNKVSALKYFSLELLRNEKLLSMASPVVSTGQIFITGNQFHPNGLFSTEIFGELGSKDRARKNGHINIGINILHPLAYIGITTMSSLHKGIIDGKIKAVWNNEIKDFTPDDVNGETGFNFYIDRLKDIEFKNPNHSDLREFKIRLAEIHTTEELTLNKVCVLAASYRDYKIDESGKPSQGEVNDLYRSMINTANMIPSNYKDVGYNTLIDNIRAKIQTLMVDIYLMSLNAVTGKRGIIQGHLLSKTVTNGTRNVITADNSIIEELGEGNHLGFNNINVGVYQHAKAINPMTIHNLKAIFLSIFSTQERTATVIDMKTMKQEKIPIDTKTIDSYTTKKGINNYINKFSDSDFSTGIFGNKDYPYIMLLDKGKEVEIITDPIFVDKEDYKYLRPITNIELLFLAILPLLDKFYASTTRYPAINQGSTFPAMPKIKPTIKMRNIKVKISGLSFDVNNYPDITSEIYDSMSLHHSRLQRLTADHDGDGL